MKKLATLGRADLLRCFGSTKGLDDATAELLGFRRRTDAWTPSLPPMGGHSDDAGETESGSFFPAPEIIFPEERPRLKFFLAVEAETLVAEEPQRDRGHPITDAELAVNWSLPGPPLPPLTRYARLGPFLRGRLGTVLPGARLDLRVLMRRAGLGLPLFVPPRLPRAAWAAQAVVLCDATPEMFPFARDTAQVLKRLRGERGAHGLLVREIKRLPSRGDLAGLPPGAPVLALSAMGQFQQAEGVAGAWVALARRLEFLGHPFHALNPCPRERWQSQIAAAWPSAVWDRHPPQPRWGGHRPVRASVDNTSVMADHLLTLLAPASRVEPPLLRAARLRLGRRANAGTEWDAWHHQACWHSLDCFGFKPGDAYAERLQRRGEMTGAGADAGNEIGGLMRAHHQTCSPALAAEAELRASLSGGGGAAALKAVKKLLRRVVDRLRLLAAQVDSSEGRRSGLPAWFTGMVDRLSPAMRANPETHELIARGLALAHACLETAHTLLPSGVDGGTFADETRAVPQRLAQPVDFRLALHGAELCFAPAAGPLAQGEMPLALLHIGSRSVHLTLPDTRNPLPPEGWSAQMHLADDQIGKLMELSAAQGLRHPKLELLMGIMRLGEHFVRDCMTPRAKVFMVPDDLSNVEAAGRLRQTNYRRVPVFGETPDEVLGILNVREFLSKPAVPYVGMLEPASYVPTSMRALDLLRRFLAHPSQLAIVVDEHGGTEGLVTLSDLLGEIGRGIRPPAVHRFQLPASPGPVILPLLSPPGSFVLESDRQRLHFQQSERPAWAERLWHDRFGVAAQFRIGGTPFVLRWIPPGRFLMGSPEDEPGRWDPEGPQHEVTISAGFWMGETPVTQAQWKAVVEEAANRPWFALLVRKTALTTEPSHFKGPGDLPVETVDWHESNLYCQLLTRLFSGHLHSTLQFHLPTEAQWEYACRAGTDAGLNDGSPCIFPTGVDPALTKLGWFDGNSGGKTHSVRQKAANRWGLRDMHGNVWEWCRDAWGDYEATPQADALHEGSSIAQRVARGGSWFSPARSCRAAYRRHGDPGDGWDGMGLRLTAGVARVEGTPSLP